MPNSDRPTTYEPVAPEYYDATRHPTSANLRYASLLVIRGWLANYRDDRWTCEIGAGRSTVAEVDEAAGFAGRRLVLIDVSPTMIAYSRRWKRQGLHLAVGDARGLPLRGETVALIVASLGDPYNVPALWREVERVLLPSGVCIFTVPAHEWAAAYRYQGPSNPIPGADFLLRGGQQVILPSYVLPDASQLELMKSAGLSVVEARSVVLRELDRESVSPKLLPERGPNAPIVSAYLVRKRS